MTPERRARTAAGRDGPSHPCPVSPAGIEWAPEPVQGGGRALGVIVAPSDLIEVKQHVGDACGAVGVAEVRVTGEPFEPLRDEPPCLVGGPPPCRDELVARSD